MGKGCIATTKYFLFLFNLIFFVSFMFWFLKNEFSYFNHLMCFDFLLCYCSLIRTNKPQQQNVSIRYNTFRIKSRLLIFLMHYVS